GDEVTSRIQALLDTYGRVLVNTYLRGAGGDWELARSLSKAYHLIDYVPAGVAIEVSAAPTAVPMRSAVIRSCGLSDLRSVLAHYREEEYLSPFIVAYTS